MPGLGTRDPSLRPYTSLEPGGEDLERLPAVPLMTGSHFSCEDSEGKTARSCQDLNTCPGLQLPKGHRGWNRSETPARGWYFSSLSHSSFNLYCEQPHSARGWGYGSNMQTLSLSVFMELRSGSTVPWGPTSHMRLFKFKCIKIKRCGQRAWALRILAGSPRASAGPRRQRRTQHGGRVGRQEVRSRGRRKLAEAPPPAGVSVEPRTRRL